MMKTQYLYGINPENLDKMLYYEALTFKYIHAKKLYEELYLSTNKNWYNTVRIFFVEKAMTHTWKLIEERTEIE